MKLKLLKHKIVEVIKLAAWTEKAYVGREHVRDQESVAALR